MSRRLSLRLLRLAARGVRPPRSRGSGDPEPERRAGAVRPRADLAVMRLDESFADVQTEARSGRRPSEVAPDELPEEAFDHLFGDAFALVRDLDDTPAIVETARHRHGAAVGVLLRVLDEVRQHLRQLVRITHDFHGLVACDQDLVLLAPFPDLAD